MAKDHFELNNYQTNRVDWNFNILFSNQPDVGRMVDDYAPALDHPGLYKPIPSQWLHSTILRLGLTSDFSEQEVLAVADVLKQKLAALSLPEFVFDSWWLWGGNVVLHISPEDAYMTIYDTVMDAARQVVGAGRIARHGDFIPHVTLAYSKEHHEEVVINRQLFESAVKPAKFRATELSLIRQWPADGHYEWEIVRALPIQQDN
jgi:2'-5' RNA ligase